MIGVGTVDIGPKEKQYVNDVLESGLLTSGPILDTFESTFAVRHGCKYGLMVNSGTDALRIALGALKEEGDWLFNEEVIVPALTFIATSNVVLQNNLTPVFVDVNPTTFNIDVDKLEKAITPCTRAIIVVHLFGLPCDMAPIMALAKRYHLKVIEDSCEAMGVNYASQPVGSFGDVACFSTYAAHVITTGVGGIAITNSATLSDLMRSLANHGRDPKFLGFKDSKQLNPSSYENPEDHQKLIETRFSFQRIGYSSRATQLQAAIGLGQLERLNEILHFRQRHYEFLEAQLMNLPGIQLQEIPEDCEHAAMMFPIVLSAPFANRTQVMLALEQRGVETRPFFNILGQKPYIEIFGDQETKFPVATQLSYTGFYVGCHQQMSATQLWKIVEAVKECTNTKVAATV